jgi:CspA family cold shock protein
MAYGSVLWFCRDRGYGFLRAHPESNDVQDGAREIFVHASAVEKAGLAGLADGERVAFDLVLSRDGHPFAVNLRVIREGEDDEV